MRDAHASVNSSRRFLSPERLFYAEQLIRINVSNDFLSSASFTIYTAFCTCAGDFFPRLIERDAFASVTASQSASVEKKLMPTC